MWLNLKTWLIYLKLTHFHSDRKQQSVVISSQTAAIYSWDHLSQSWINSTLFHSSVIIKLFNNSNFKEWLQWVHSHWLLKGCSWNEHKGNFIFNEWAFLKVKHFSSNKTSRIVALHLILGELARWLCVYSALAINS